MFRSHWPLSTAYKTVLYAVDKCLHSRSVLHSQLLWVESALYVLRSISSQQLSNEPLRHQKRLCCVPLHALRWKCAMNVQEISEEEEFEVLVSWHTVSLHQWIIYS